jgi:hypothetical protein
MADIQLLAGQIQVGIALPFDSEGHLPLVAAMDAGTPGSLCELANGDKAIVGKRTRKARRPVVRSVKTRRCCGMKVSSSGIERRATASAGTDVRCFSRRVQVSA